MSWWSSVISMQSFLISMTTLNELQVLHNKARSSPHVPLQAMHLGDSVGNLYNDYMTTLTTLTTLPYFAYSYWLQWLHWLQWWASPSVGPKILCRCRLHYLILLSYWLYDCTGHIDYSDYITTPTSPTSLPDYICFTDYPNCTQPHDYSGYTNYTNYSDYIVIFYPQITLHIIFNL